MACVLVDPDIELRTLINQSASAVRSIHPEFADCIARVPDLLDLEVADAAREVASMGLIQRELDEQPYDWPGISPFVIPTVVWSLWSALKAGGDFMEAVLLAIEPGGDVDTTAAIAGAIAGTRIGRSALPQNLADLVHDGGSWRADELAVLGEAVVRRSKAIPHGTRSTRS